MRRWLLVPLVLCLAAWNMDMDPQRRDNDYGGTSLFPHGMVMRAPPSGTISRDDPAEAKALEDRPAMSMRLLRRGRERYDIYCVPCHDEAGTGHGIVVSRGFPAPPSYLEPRLLAASARHIVDVITHGFGVMYSFADRVAPADRWAIAAYIQALQLSQHAVAASLPASDQQKLRDSDAH